MGNGHVGRLVQDFCLVFKYPIDQPHQAQRMTRGERQIRAFDSEPRGLKGLQVQSIERLQRDSGVLSQAPRGERTPHIAVDLDRCGLSQRSERPPIVHPSLERFEMTWGFRLSK